MSRFKSQFRRAGAVATVRQFGELIVYYPGGSTDEAREIQAIVERGEEVVDGQVTPAILCRVIDDTTLGIGSLEINDGRDQVSVADVSGGTRKRRELTRMTDDSNGMVRFKIR